MKEWITPAENTFNPKFVLNNNKHTSSWRVLLSLSLFLLNHPYINYMIWFFYYSRTFVLRVRIPSWPELNKGIFFIAFLADVLFVSFVDYDLDAFRDIKPFQIPKSKDCERYSDLPTNGFLNWAACPQPPRYAEMPPPLQRIQTNNAEEVVFFNVQKCYEKVQCRKNKKSKQRVQGATINLRVTTDTPISKVEVYVERLPKAAVLCGDSNGRVPLKLKMENLMYSDVSIYSVVLLNKKVRYVIARLYWTCRQCHLNMIFNGTGVCKVFSSSLDNILYQGS